MSDAHNEQQSAIKTPKQLLAAVAGFFLITVIGIILLVQFVTAQKLTGAGSDSQSAEAIEERLSPVANAGYTFKDASGPKVLQSGEAIYTSTCVACHGPQGHGMEAMGAPNLTLPAGYIYGTSLAQLQQTIRHGRQGQMPAQEVLQGNDKVHLLAAYVYSLSHNADGATPESPAQ